MPFQLPVQTAIKTVNRSNKLDKFKIPNKDSCEFHFHVQMKEKIP